MNNPQSYFCLLESYVTNTQVLQNLFYLAILFLTSTAKAAVLPDYATNTYQNHDLTRAEQKCIDEGYKITYANCPKQTAPDEKCPHHDNYYKYYFLFFFS